MSKKLLSGINVTGTATLNTVADAGSNTGKFLVLDSSNNVSYRTAAELYADLGIGSTAAAYTSTLKHEVKASQTIGKGQAVYVSSADGTNMIVSKASNVSGQLSSKTMGLLETSLVNNGKGNVITEGLLSGLNTNGAVAGDPVWLGVDGALIYGLVNKPYAPAHLVFIGIVTRANSNNGEIFVKVQNGFEMNELHNYQEGSVQNNQVVVYESATSLYKPKTIPTILGYTPVPDSRTITINGTTYDLTANRSWTISANLNARTEYEFNTNGSTATYSAVYSIGQVDVFYNGSKLSSTEFTATNGTSVTLGFTPPSGQLVEVVAWETGGGVTSGRILTINGVSYDLSADRSWTITQYTDALARAAISLTTTGTSGAATYNSTTGVLNVPQYAPDLSGYVPTTRTISINGTTLDLSANVSFTIAAGLTSFNTRTGAITLSSGDVTTALGFTPYNATNPTGYITSAALSTYATQSYVGTQIANLVASSPAALDTLNELAAALGNDASFSTTVSTALGNRLRVDINTQGLSATLQGYGRTNLGLGTAATSNTGDFAAASHTHSIANVTGLQTALDGKQASLGYTPYNSTNPSGYITGITSANVTTALGFTPYNATNPAGYITGISFANVSAKPTTLAGYGITDAVPSSRTITINGTAFDLSANRSWTISGSDATKLPLAGGTMTGKIFTVSTGTGTYDTAIEIRETGYVTTGQSAWGYSPAMTFHWGGRYAKRFGMRSDGLFAIDDEPLALRSWVTSLGYITGSYLPLSGGTVTGDVTFGNNSANDQGIKINYGNYSSGYGRIRFMQDGTNHSTIHSFSASWQNGTLQSASSGAINIDGQNGVTIGPWNNPSVWVNNTGTISARVNLSTLQVNFRNSSNNAFFTGNSDWGLRLANDNGYIQFGPANSSWTHIYTDKNFYFNQNLYINGNRVYADDYRPYADTAGNLSGFNKSEPTFGNVYNTGWFRNYGDAGLYNQDYASHLRRSTSASYGTWEAFGYNKGGYAGVNIIDPQGYWANYMHESGNGGLYSQNYRGDWVWYHNAGQNCTSFNGSATDGGVRFRVNGSMRVTGDLNPQGYTGFGGNVEWANGSTQYHGSNTGYTWRDWGGWGGYWWSRNGGDTIMNLYALYAVTGSISDIRYKKDVEALPYGLKEIMQLNPIKYHYNLPKESMLSNDPDYFLGFSAQEVQALIPEAVHEKIDEDVECLKGMLAITYDELIPVTVQAIKEQQVMIHNQNIRIQKLEALVTQLLNN